MVFVENGAQDFQFNILAHFRTMKLLKAVEHCESVAPVEEVRVVFEENLAVINILDDDGETTNSC